MKKFIYSIAGALLFGMASCDSLNLSPEDYAAAGNYWQNAEQVGTYMNGLHSTLRSDYSSPLNLGELRGGTMREGTSSINTSLNSSSIIRNDLRTTSTGVNTTALNGLAWSETGNYWTWDGNIEGFDYVTAEDMVAATQANDIIKNEFYEWLVDIGAIVDGQFTDCRGYLRGSDKMCPGAYDPWATERTE